MAKKDDPVTQNERARAAMTAELLKARARLVKAREAQAEALNEFEQAVVRGVQVLDGPTEVQKLLGFTSRSSVTAIVSRVNARPAE